MLFSPARAFATILLGCSLICAAQNTPPPSWVYSTYFGGSGQDDLTAMTRDSVENVYIVGTSNSPDFPTTHGVYEQTYPGPSGAYAVYVSKFSAAGALVWSTFLGPGSNQWSIASSVQVDANQNVYVAGIFEGTGFPTTSGLPNSGSVFVSKLSADGSTLVYSTTIGGYSVLANPKLVLDTAANAFVIGSGDVCCNAHTGIIGPLGGISDFWVAEINAAGTGSPWSVAIGGSGMDLANALGIDASNRLYVTGYSDSRDFPMTAGTLNQPGVGRTFVIKVNPALPPSSSLIYSAMLGNPGNSPNDYIEGDTIALDKSDNVYVGAWTYNSGLYTSKSAFQSSALAPPNVYVFELNQSGSALLNGTYIEGSYNDFVWSLSVDGLGNVYVSGDTYSWDFLTTAYGPQGPAFNTGQAFYVKLNPQFAAISSVEFGGNGNAAGWALVPDGAGGLWVAGVTGASQFPTTANAYQPKYHGNYDAYLLHTNFAPLCHDEDEEVGVCSIAADPNLPERINFTAQASHVRRTTTMRLQIDGMVAYGIHAAQFDTWLPVAAGQHTATAIAQDANGEQHQHSKSFSVAASAVCPLNPVTPSLTFCSPLNAAVIQGPMTVQVAANDSVPPATVSLFVDGAFVAKITGQNGTYTYTLQLPPGVHRLAAMAKDNQGFLLRTTAVARVTQ